MDPLDDEFGNKTLHPLHNRGAIGLVVLSNSFVELTLDSLRQGLDQLYPGQFLPPREQGSFVVEGNIPEAEYFINSDIPGSRGMFLLTTVPGPYSLFSNFEADIADPALRRRAEEQACWLSVTLVHKSATEAEAHRFIGSVLAHLAPDDSAALVQLSTMTTVAFDADLRRQLATGSDRWGTA
jgi:hypothetical protein